MKAKCAIAVFCFTCAITLGQSDTDLWAKYRQDLSTNRASSVTQFRIGELYFQQRDFLSAANTFREALAGDLQPKWVEVWKTCQNLTLGNERCSGNGIRTCVTG